MQIIAHKNNLYNNKDFIYKAIEKQENMTGIMLDIVKTKDHRLLVFSPVSNNKRTIDTIQNNQLEEIAFLDILTLEEALIILKEFKAKILLNLFPLNEAFVIEDYQKTVKENEDYVDVVKSVIQRFPNLNIYLCSSSQSLLYHVIRKIEDRKNGVILSVNDSTYIDVDFYIFSPEMLNEKILLQQLMIGKEVMIQMQDCDDMTKVVTFLLEEIQDKKKIEQMQFITNHTRLLYLIARAT